MDGDHWQTFCGAKFVDSYLASLALPDRSTLLGSSEWWALLLLLLLLVAVLEVLHHLAVPLPLLLRVVLRQLKTES